MTQIFSEIIASWPTDTPFCARTAISECQHAVTNDHLFELAIEECLDTIDRKGSVEVSTFVLQFPEIQDRLLPFLNMIPQCTDHGWPRVGDKIGGFKIIQMLGLGECSRVFLTEDEKAGGRATVIKIRTDQSNEAIYLARMNHPSVCTLYQSTEDTRCIHLRYVAGQNGSSYLASLKNAPDGILMPPLLSEKHAERFITAIECVSSAIIHIHTRGVAHNDIRPSNIVFGQSDTVLIDFDAASEIGIHGTRRPVGTIDYLSNESLEELSRNGQLICQNCIHDDYFAFAVTCFELLTGSLPWSRSKGEITPALCKVMQQERMRMSINSEQFKSMHNDLSRAFVDVFTSTTPPYSPVQLSRLIRTHIGADSIPHDQSLSNRAKARESTTKGLSDGGIRLTPRPSGRLILTMSGLSIASVITFAILISTLIPVFSNKEMQSKIEASNDILISEKRNIPPPFESNKSHSTSHVDIPQRDAASIAYRLYLNTKDYEGQIRLYEVAISNGNSRASVWNNYGYSLVCARRPVEARKAFLAAIRIDPNLPQPFFHLAVLDEVCPGKFGAAPLGVNALSALQLIPNEPVVRRLASSALKSLSDPNNRDVESQETARLLSELLHGTRHLTPCEPISPCVDPSLPNEVSFAQGRGGSREK